MYYFKICCECSGSLAVEQVFHRDAELRRTHRDCDTRGHQRCNLVRRRTTSARNDRAGMAHPPAFRCGLSGDEGDYRFLKVFLDVSRGFLFSAAANLADHDDRARARILVEQLQNFDMAAADDRIAANADARRLPNSQL